MSSGAPRACQLGSDAEEGPGTQPKALQGGQQEGRWEPEDPGGGADGVIEERRLKGFGLGRKVKEGSGQRKKGSDLLFFLQPRVSRAV